MRKPLFAELAFLALVLILIYSALSIWVSVELSQPPSSYKYQHQNSEKRNEFARYACRFVNLTCDYKTTENNSKSSDPSNNKVDQRSADPLDPDLFAQQGMWRAANTLVWLTLIQVLMGATTIYIVFRTFGVQSKELEATKDANALQLKPYLEFESCKITGGGFIPEFTPSVQIHLIIKNIGNTIAIDISNLEIESISISPQAAQTGNKAVGLDAEKYRSDTEEIVRKSLEKSSFPENFIRAALPNKTGIARTTLNPNSCLEFIVCCPLINAEGLSLEWGSKVNNYSLECSFSFEDSFPSENRRVVDVTVFNSTSTASTLREGVGVSVGNATAGELIERK